MNDAGPLKNMTGFLTIQSLMQMGVPLMFVTHGNECGSKCKQSTQIRNAGRSLAETESEMNVTLFYFVVLLFLRHVKLCYVMLHCVMLC